jgi:hypothetical protein
MAIDAIIENIMVWPTEGISMPKKMRYGLLTILGLVMAFSVVGTAGAQEARPLKGRQSVHGELTAIDGQSLTVESERGEILVIANEDIHVYIVGQEGANLANLSIGDQIIARGSRQEDGSIMARIIVRLPEGDHAVGRIATISDNSLALHTRDTQELLVYISPDTLVNLRGEDLSWVDLPADTLHAGMLLHVFGTTSGDGLRLDAHTLISPRLRPRVRRLVGQINAIEGDEFTLATLRGDVQKILTTENTRIRLRGVEEPTLDDLAVNDVVIVVGRQSGEGEISALKVIGIPASRLHGRPILGSIETIGSGEITLSAYNGNVVTIITDASTRYRIGTNKDATVDEFNAGDTVAVLGRWEPGNGLFHARHVMKRG